MTQPGKHFLETLLGRKYANFYRYFVGGTILNRPSLTEVGGSIIAGFGGHCDNFNYTGMLLSVTKTTGAVTNVIAMEASPGAPSPQALDYTVQGGGKAGIWQSGMGIANDGGRVFFVTGYVGQF
jgi:iron transport multicopper oxidase